jgi:hypothetical protein
VIFAFIAHAAPVVKSVETRSGGHLVLERSTTGKRGLVMGLDFHPGALAVSFTLAAPHRDRSGIRIRIHIKTVIAGLQNGERLVRRIDFISLSAEEMADVQIQRALIQFNLDDIVADVGQRHAGFGIHAQRGAP